MSGVSNVVLRRANVADASSIAAVRVESWRVTYRDIIPDSYLDAMRVDDSTEIWLRVLSAPVSPATAVFVAEVDGRIVGFSAGMILEEEKFGFESELTGIYVIPDAQERGLGTQLVRLVAAGFSKLGANGMLVWVPSDNKVARQFYEKLGGEQLIEQAFTWDDLELQEVGYGFRDLTTLAL